MMTFFHFIIQLEWFCKEWRNLYARRTILMREYQKPIMIDEELELKDCIAVSNGGNTTDGESGALEDIMGGILS